MSVIKGNDGQPANDDIGGWAKEKHMYLLRYLEISRAARKKFLGGHRGGAAYFDLFCATGKSRIKKTGEWIDGSAIAAWKASVQSKAPFSGVYISDIDEESLSACATRLKKLGAPVFPIHASATVAAKKMVSCVNSSGLHIAFVDPYNLSSLDFEMISILSTLSRIDLLIHYSAMDFQRNLDMNLLAEHSDFDTLAPGWRETVDITGSQGRIRENIYEYWKKKIADLGFFTSTDQKLITGKKNQPLYRLLVASRHPLANKFWSVAVNPQGQGDLGF
jgi:three-Cys-motif partner protein